MKPSKQYQEYVPTGPSESPKIRKLAMEKLKDFTSLNIPKDEKAAFMSAMKLLNDELIGIPPPQPRSSPPKQQQEQRKHNLRASADFTKPGLRTASFDSLRKLQNLRCSAFPSSANANSCALEQVSNPEGRRRAAAQLQQSLPVASSSTTVNPNHSVAQQQQQQAPSPHFKYENFKNDEPSQDRHDQLNQQRIQQSYRPQELPNEDTRRPNRPVHQMPAPEHMRQAQQDLLAHALQTADASPPLVPLSHPSPPVVSTAVGTATGSNFKGDHGGVVVPVYHGEDMIDEFLKNKNAAEGALAHTSSDGHVNSVEEVTIFEDSDDDSDSDHGGDCDIKYDEHSALTSSDSDADSHASSSGSGSVSVEDLDVKHGGHTPVRHGDGQNSHTDILKNSLDAAANKIHPSNDTPSVSSASVSSSRGKEKLMCWDDIDDTLSYVKVSREEPGTSSTGPVEERSGVEQDTPDRDKEKENKHNDNVQLDKDSGSRTGQDSVHSDRKEDMPPFREKEHRNISYNSNSNMNYMHRGDRKAYEAPRGGGTLDLSGLSFEHIHKLTNSRARGGF